MCAQVSTRRSGCEGYLTKRCHTHVCSTITVVPTRKPTGTAESPCTSAAGLSQHPSSHPAGKRSPETRSAKVDERHRSLSEASSPLSRTTPERQSWGMLVFPSAPHSFPHSLRPSAPSFVRLTEFAELDSATPSYPIALYRGIASTLTD